MRIYKKNNNDYISVTSILSLLEKDSLIQWAVNKAIDLIKDNINNINEQLFENAKYAHKNIKNESADIGSQTHQLIETYIIRKINNKNTELSFKDYNNKAVLYFYQFLEWEKKYEPVFIASEIEVFDNNMFVAGTIDCVCMIKNELYLIDFKTSSNIYKTHEIQVSAYKYMYEMNCSKIDKCAILQLNDNDFKFKKINNVKRNYHFFEQLTLCWYLLANRKINNGLTKYFYNFYKD